MLLLRLGNLKHREIGEQLGIGVKSVSAFLARALEKLHLRMGEGGRGEVAKNRAQRNASDALR